MSGNKPVGKAPVLEFDYGFVVPTPHYGKIALHLRNGQQSLSWGRVQTPEDNMFYQLVGKDLKKRERVVTLAASCLITTDPADTVKVNGESRSLSEAVEELYAGEVELQQAEEDAKPRGLKKVFSVLEQIAVGRPEPSENQRHVQSGLLHKRLMQKSRQVELTTGLLEYGLRKGVITMDYVMAFCAGALLQVK